jgi:inosine-uridine nucleoside N-ribohydrolase
MIRRNGRLLVLVTAVVFIWCLLSAPAPAQSTAHTPILIDTDVGADIDDAFALGLAFGSPALDVRGITTVGDDAHKKAMLICRFLTATGRRHTRVAVGAKPQPSRPITDLYKYYYHPDPLFNRTTKPEQQSAVEFLYGRLNPKSKTTLVALGPLTNIARLIEEHPDATAMIERVILMESNVAMDIAAARKVFSAKLPLLAISDDACQALRLDDKKIKKVFSPGTALTRQVQAMYQMWDRPNPPLGETLAVAMCLDQRFAKFEERSVIVNQQGQLTESNDAAPVRIVTSVKSAEFADWYTGRMAALLPPSRRPSRWIAPGRMPHRVHVAEDFERFWWMSGKPETNLLPSGSRRACRGVLTHDFDDLLMASRQMYTAVIFNPVPGPPMGKNTRLSFRYWLKGTDTIRVQIYSLTNGYHRHLVVKNLAQEKWQHAAVDMTEARRPDGTGGPLAENERIDDIQFYIDPEAEIVIDDIVLYDAATQDEKRPVPQRIMFTGTFDTGKQGQHWPGEFDIVADAGNFWKAARSVQNDKTGTPWLRIGLRGLRRLSGHTNVSFRYRLTGTETLDVLLVNSKTGKMQPGNVRELRTNGWADTTIQFDTRSLPAIDEIHILLPEDASLLIDDLLLFEPSADLEEQFDEIEPR